MTEVGTSITKIGVYVKMDGTTFITVFECSDCTHYTDGKCDNGYPVDEYEDAYDCVGFSDVTYKKEDEAC